MDSIYSNNPLVKPLTNFLNMASCSFDKLPCHGEFLEIAKRVVIIAIAPFAYLTLGLIALGGLFFNSFFKNRDVKILSNKFPQKQKTESKNLGEKYPSGIDNRHPTSFKTCFEDKNNHPHELIGQIQIPIRASDINLPNILPKDIPDECDISGDKWLIQNHLHRYITFLSTQFSKIALRSNPFTYTIDSLKSVLFEYMPSEINEFNKLNIPIYLHVTNDHWTLVYIDREKRTIEYYDSKKNYGNHLEIVRELTEISNILSEKESDKPPYRFVCKINKILQPDSYQCGIWILYFLENRLINPEFDFNQLDVNESQPLIKKYRIKVMLKLIEMYHAESSTLKKEGENYNQYYTDPGEACEKWRKDRSKIPYIDRWKQIFRGQCLDPR